MNRRTARALAAALVVATGCATERPVSAPLGAPVATPIASPISEASPPGSRCPIVPMDLIAHLPNGLTQRLLSLDAAGVVRQTMMGAPDIGRLDPRGCLVTDDGVDVDVTASGAIWTRYDTFRCDGTTMSIANGRAMRIAPNGDVETLMPNGEVEPGTYGTFGLRGYDAHGACAARVLMVTMFAMMPSMAVSDGHPRILPAPIDSACAELHGAK